MTTHASGARRKDGTPPVSNQNMMTLGAHWAAMSGDAKRAWLIIAAAAANILSPFGKARVTGWNLFVATNSLHLDMGGSVQEQAPSSYSPPAPLQPVRCNVTVDNGQTSVVLVPNVPYTGDVVLYGAEPSVANVTVRRPGSYKLLGKLSGIGASQDVSALYLSHFHVPGSSYQISLKLVPVSAAGFRGTPLFVPGFSLAPGQQLPDKFNPDHKDYNPNKLRVA